MEQADFFHALQLQFDDALPFVAYRLPEEKKVTAFLQEDEALHEINNFDSSGFVFAPFDNTLQKAVLLPSETCKVITLPNFELSPTTENDFLIEDLEINLNEYDHHISILKEAITKIKQGEFVKVVLSRKQYIPNSNKSPISILKRLLTEYSTAFVYCWYHPKIGLWLGATPETLVSIDNRKLKTMALAGTQKFNGKLEVEWGAKEKQEQQIVTDTIVQNLKQIVDNLEVSEALTAKAGNLLHLKTTISASVNPSEIDLSKIINALHPTPAICGLPKAAAKKFILNNENYNRAFYSGFLGELNLKTETKRARSKRNIENQVYASIQRRTSLFVNLRCMEIDAKGAQLFVGGGITQTSNPEDEWQETVNKLSTITTAL